jgi:hypothetical protein
VSGGASVPEAEPRDAVGVDVLWSPLELGEHGKIVAGILGSGMCHLEENGAVALHDERAVGQSHQESVPRRVWRRVGATIGEHLACLTRS